MAKKKVTSKKKKVAKKAPTKKKTQPKYNWFVWSGVGLFAAGLVLMLSIFWPALELEWQYRHRQAEETSTSSETEIVPLDTDFGIVIPKIGANAAIVENVDPFNSRAYQVALTKGVAHAKGSVTPDKTGNMFLFSHSSVDFFEARRYNSIFYLLNKLETGDEIDIYYEDEEYKYQVTDTKLVWSSDVGYLSPKASGKQLTLMTCWPPGTTYKRLLVVAEQLEEHGDLVDK